MKKIYFVLLLATWSAIANGQKVSHTLSKDKATPSPAASIEDFTWIAGHWQGEAFGGQTEEVWTKPLGSSMMGSFKLVHGDKVTFYELCVLREIDNTVLFELKHFNEDLKGWEEKDETVAFPLVKYTDDVAYFDGITFEKISEDEMHVFVIIEQDDEETEEVSFVYHRVKN